MRRREVRLRENHAHRQQTFGRLVAMRTASEWKELYARERASLGQRALEGMLDRAPEVWLPARGALVFPHTRLSRSGELVAAVARAVVQSGADRVLALGVLHGARAEDQPTVEAARRGDAEATALLRRVHGAQIPGDASRWSEEFSLDGFAVLIELAARRAGRKAPELVLRYPFLVGDEPASLPGIDALLELTSSGCVLVGTTDPLHHGLGYGTEAAFARDAAAPETVAWARDAIAAQTRALEGGDYAAFQQLARAHRSDFRDTGPVLAHLLRARGALSFEQHALTLVDYSDVLEAPPPTWVAAAMLSAHVH